MVHFVGKYALFGKCTSLAKKKNDFYKKKKKKTNKFQGDSTLAVC